MVENHKGQWIQHLSTTASMAYQYDLLGRLTGVHDGAGNVCTSRLYAYDSHTNRTGIGSAAAPAGAGCTATAAVTGAYTYDSADRLMTSPQGGAGTWLYDPFGRTTTMPVVAGTLKNTYYVNDLIAAQTIPGQSQYSWTLDPLQRRSTNTQQNWNGTGWTTSAVKTFHFSNDSDEPTWVASGSAFTRYLSGVEGDLALATATDGSKTLQLVDLHGDIAGTVPVTGSSLGTVAFLRTDEFGNPEPLAGQATANAPPRYGWLGASQRSGETLGGLTLMGVRLYSPATGRFLSTDPVPGGSANAYDYCSADPVNCTDLAGTFSFGSLLKVVAVVGEVASMIPGPIGAAAAGVSAIAYAAQGNKSKAIEMGITAAAALVGAGPVVKVASRVAGAARAAGQAALRAAPKLQRAAAAVSRTVARVSPRAARAAESCAINSFVPGTLVLMADGSLKPIEDVGVGDEVWSTDDETGDSAPEDVLAQIAGRGTKHLIEITTAGGTWTATDNHPIWVQGQGWTYAGDILPGDHLIAADNTELTVTLVEDLGDQAGQTVYNLTIDNVHTYYVAEPNGTTALVHNCPTGKGLPNAQARDLAHYLGFKPVKGEFSHGRAVFKKGKTYISADWDSHQRQAAVWKVGPSLRDLRERTSRTYTADHFLNWIAP